MRGYLGRYGPLAFTLVVFAAVGAALYHELARYDWHAVMASIEGLSGWRLTGAVALAVGSYLAASANDYLGVRYAGRHLPAAVTTPIGFICYAVSYNVGFTALGGTAMRYQLYASRGLGAVEIAKVVIFECTSFFIGVCALVAILMVAGVPAIEEALQIPPHTDHVLGAILLAALGAYLVASWRGVGSLGWRSWRLAIPAPPLAVGQILGSILDIGLAAATMHWLLPDVGLSYWEFLPLFLAAMLTGLASTVPGGLGVIEAVMLALLRGRGDEAAILGGLLAYRFVYYLIPLGFAMLLLVALSLHRRRREMAGLFAASLERAPALIPRSLASAVYLAAVFLLVSGILPPDPQHVRWLDGFFPRVLVEAAYPACAALGVALLFLARGVQRGLAGAYRWTLAALAVGVACALLRGMDYAAALVMALPLLPLLTSGGLFQRKKKLFSQNFSGQWLATTVSVLAIVALVALVVLAQQGKIPPGDASGLHAVRLVGVLTTMAIATLALTILRLLADRRQRVRPLAGVRASEVAARLDPAAATRLPAHARLLLSEDGDAALAFTVSRGRWEALGAPLGNPSSWLELVWTFTDAAELAGCVPVASAVPRDAQLVFQRAGFIPIDPHPDDSRPSDRSDLPAADTTFLTRSLGMEIRSLMHAERKSVWT